MAAEKTSIIMPSRKSSTVYENWKVYSKHGRLMFRCNQKKAEWYLKRDLATMLDEKAIQLTFEAKGEGHAGNDYMIEDRDNFCVVCASHKDLTLHHVVPYVYRQWFPLVIKSKSSRDLILLCKHCHTEYEEHATALKKSYAKAHGVPLEGKGWVQVPENRMARKAASALLRKSDKIPPSRQEELKAIVQQFWEAKKSGACNDKKENDTEWTTLDWDQVLSKCCELKDVYPGPDFVEHGQAVVKDLMANAYVDEHGKERWPDLESFVKQWRQHFLDYACPKYLSKRWTVDGDIYVN